VDLSEADVSKKDDDTIPGAAGAQLALVAFPFADVTKRVCA